MDTFMKLLDALTKLLVVLVWPAVTVFVLIRFGPVLKQFFENLGEISLKAGGVAVSAKRNRATAAIAAATVFHAEAGAAPAVTARKARKAAQSVAEIVTPRIIEGANGATVLWVDDRPSNNIHERQAFEAVGVRFELAKSTDEALEILNRDSFDAIISDMGRPPDQQAGYTLLEKLRASGDQTPFVIYAGSRSPEHIAEAKRRGAIGCTNSPDELFEMVVSVLGMRR